MRRVEKFSPHFQAWEFIDRRAGALPPNIARAGLKRLCQGPLELLRAEFGPVRVTSGFRTAATNRAVGGAPASRHQYDRFPSQVGADVVARGGRPLDWFYFLDEHHPGGLGLYPGHVHVDMRPVRTRW